MASAWLLAPLPMVAGGNSTAAGFDPNNLTLDYAGVVWRAPVGDYAYIVFDLGYDRPIDTLFLFGIRGPGYEAQLNVSLATSAQGTFNGAYWVGYNQPLYSSAVIPSSGGVAIWTADNTAPAAARYVSLRFGNMGSGTQLEASRLVIGSRFQPQRNFSFGGSFGVRDLGSLDFSRRGVLLRSRGKKLRTVGLTFSSLYKDEVEGVTKPLLEQIGNTEMIGLLTDPADDPQRQNRAYFGPLVGDLGHTWRNASGWEAKVNLVSIF